MRMSTAYFAGAGTVAMAIALGLGGGFLIAEMMNPRTPQVAKVERKSPDAPPAKSAAPNSYLAATQGAATTPVVVQPSAATSADNKTPEQPQPAADKADNKPSPADGNPQSTADNKPQPQPSPSPVTAAAAPPAASEASPPAAHQRANAPEAANAKASDADVKSDGKSRDSDSRRAERERRRAERHQHWVERRRNQHQPDIRDVEQAVREDSAQRDPAPRAYRESPPREVREVYGDAPRREEAPRREYVAEPVGPAMPRFNLFGDDGD